MADMSLNVTSLAVVAVLLLVWTEGLRLDRKARCRRQFNTARSLATEVCRLRDLVPKLERTFHHLQKAVQRNGRKIKHAEQKKSLQSESCPYEYQTFENGLYEYKTCDTCETWERAREICREDGGDLLTIETEREYDYFLHLELPDIEGCKQKASPWIGLTDKEKEGTWVWLNRQHMSKKDNHWRTGQPDNVKDNEHCAQIRCRAGTCGLNDFPCEMKQQFLCKRYIK